MCSKNARENKCGNQEWTIQRHRQHWANDTEPEKGNKKDDQNGHKKQQNKRQVNPELALYNKTLTLTLAFIIIGYCIYCDLLSYKFLPVTISFNCTEKWTTVDWF